MKKFGKMLGKAFVFCIVMIVLCSFVYPPRPDRCESADHEE